MSIVDNCMTSISHHFCKLENFLCVSTGHIVMMGDCVWYGQVMQSKFLGHGLTFIIVLVRMILCAIPHAASGDAVVSSRGT